MDAPDPHLPTFPDSLHAKMRALQHDLAKMKEHHRNGHLKPSHYGAVERIMRERLVMVEAEVQARLLAESRMSKLPKGLRLS